MLHNHMDELSGFDYMDELSHDDHMVSLDDRWLSPQSHFSKIYDEDKLMRKYREIDDAIHHSDFDYLQNLVKKEMLQTINLSDDPLLSVVIAYEKRDLAMKLLEVMPEMNLMASNCYDDTALHVAAAKGDITVVETLVKKCKELMGKTNKNLETPLHKAALYGERDVFWKLVELGSKIEQRREDGSTMLHCAVMGNAPDLAIEIASEYQDLMTSRNSRAVTPLQLLLTIPEAFRSKLQLGPLGSFIYDFIPLEEKPVLEREGYEEDLEKPMMYPSKDEGKHSLMTLRQKFPPNCYTLFDLHSWQMDLAFCFQCIEAIIS